MGTGEIKELMLKLNDEELREIREEAIRLLWLSNSMIFRKK